MEAVNDGAVRQHRLHTNHQIPGHSVSDDPVTTGIGRKVAANRAAATGAQIERKKQGMNISLFLNCLQFNPCFNRHRRGDRINLYD